MHLTTAVSYNKHQLQQPVVKKGIASSAKTVCPPGTPKSKGGILVALGALSGLVLAGVAFLAHKLLKAKQENKGHTKAKEVEPMGTTVNLSITQDNDGRVVKIVTSKDEPNNEGAKSTLNISRDDSGEITKISRK